MFNAKRKLAVLASVLASVLCACSSGTTSETASSVEDSSPSGVAASTVGGALAGSSSSGTVAYQQYMQKASPHQWLIQTLMPKAHAANSCPTILSAVNAGCIQTSSAVATLNYSSCNFGDSLATWTGYESITLGSAANVTCGTFPSPGSTTLNRQFVTSNGTTPGSIVRTSALGTAITVDDATSNLNNYQLDGITNLIGSGYGSKVTFVSGARTGVTVAHHIYGALFNHSVTGNVSVNEVGSNRTVSGSVTVYHNLLKIKGVSTFTSVVYNDTCCTPVSGTISTQFQTTSNSGNGPIVTAMNGKSETLTISSCGIGTLVDYTGASKTVILDNCF